MAHPATAKITDLGRRITDCHVFDHASAEKDLPGPSESLLSEGLGFHQSSGDRHHLSSNAALAASFNLKESASRRMGIRPTPRPW